MKNRSEFLIPALCALLSIGIWVYDIYTPLGVAVGLLYVVVVVLASRHSYRNVPILVAAIVSVLSFVGWYMSPAGGETGIVLTNRMLSLLAICGTALLVRRVTDSKAAEQLTRQQKTSLEILVRQRTRELLTQRDRLRDLASDLTRTEQRERRRLATDLHDYLAQLLVVCRMKVQQLLIYPKSQILFLLSRKWIPC